MSKAKMVPIDRDNFKDILKKRGLTQRALCEQIDHPDYISTLTPEYLSKCLKSGYISATLTREISCKLDVTQDYLSGESAAPLPKRWDETENSWNNENETIAPMMGLALHHRLDLSDLSPGDQESLSIILQYVCYYFALNKGYLDSFKDCAGDRITDDQLFDIISELMAHDGANKREPESLDKFERLRK